MKEKYLSQLVKEHYIEVQSIKMEKVTCMNETVTAKIFKPKCISKSVKFEESMRPDFRLVLLALPVLNSGQFYYTMITGENIIWEVMLKKINDRLAEIYVCSQSTLDDTPHYLLKRFSGDYVKSFSGDYVKTLLTSQYE